MMTRARRIISLAVAATCALALGLLPSSAAAQEAASVTIVKDGQDAFSGANIPQAFTFTTSGGGLPASFTLDDDDPNPGVPPTPTENSITFPVSEFGPKTITEGYVGGWATESISCTGDDGYSADARNRVLTLDVDPGETISCTWVNLGGVSDINEFTTTPHPSPITPVPTQAGGHPHMLIHQRYCDPQTPEDPVNEGCGGALIGSFLKEFSLRLAPGAVGNPTATPTCPISIFIGGLCPPNTIVGWSLSRTVQTNGGFPSIPTPVYNLQTIGLEPARLGTGTLPTDDPGPLPVTVTLRTTSDFGIDSQVKNIPYLFGIFAAKVEYINTVLCGQAPCTAGFTPSSPNQSVDINSIQAAPGAKPFFTNPTSCDEPTRWETTLRTWTRPDLLITERNDKTQAKVGTEIVTTRSEPYTPTGCEEVPFDLDVNFRPVGAPKSDDPATVEDEEGDRDTNPAAGSPTGMEVTLDYPDDYKDEAIWQSNLREADVTLPEGVSLGTGGGVGLVACSSEQFYGGPSFEQRTNDPIECPEGSEIGKLTVTSPVLPASAPLSGKAYFGPATAPGRPTPESPWKLFLTIEGAGLRLKLPAGDVSLTPTGQIRTVFRNQPQVPFDTLTLTTRAQGEDGKNAVLANPATCGTHEGATTLLGWSGTEITDAPVLSDSPESDEEVDPPPLEMTGCGPKPFQPVVEDASAIPTKAGANSISHLRFTVPEGHQTLRTLKLALPPGAVGSLAAVPNCPAEIVRQLASNPNVNCPIASKVGVIKTTVGTGNSLLTVPGSVYIGESVNYGDAASFVIVVPAKVGPIDLGRVAIVNRAVLRQSDTGIDVYSPDIPAALEGVPLPIRAIDITIDREGFFLNPTGCDTRTFVGSFTSYEDPSTVASSSFATAATDCASLKFQPRLQIIAGTSGLTDEGVHPPLKAIVTQEPGEANIAKAKVVIPDLIRPNVPQFQKPGALCNDAQLAARACPPQSQVGTTSVITPVLPFKLSGPVYIVQEAGHPLPKLAVFLRGGNGLEVVLNATNGFQGIRIANTFLNVPDVPQARFELNINGGPNGILNAFSDLCTTRPLPQIDATFNGHNGKTFSDKPRIEVDGCPDVGARMTVSGRVLKMSKKGVVSVKLRCPVSVQCGGAVSLNSAGKVRTSAKARRIKIGTRSYKIAGRKTRTVKIRVTKQARKVIVRRKKLKSSLRVTLKGARTTSRTVTIQAPKR